jgi:hypothetical protein
MSKRGTDDLSDFLHEFDKLTILSMGLALAVPFALDRIFSLQPPWPPQSTYITAFLELCIIFFSFTVSVPSKTALRKFQSISLFVLVLLFFSYFFLYSVFVFETPLTSERVVAGYRCSQDAQLVAAQLRESCPFLSESSLAAAQYETELVWTPASVRLVEFVIFACWTSFFLLATAFFAITLQYLRKQRIRSREKGRKGENGPGTIVARSNE